MALTCYAQTDPGLRRPVNEDSYCARPELGLFVVADGLGGHPGGHVASRLVTRAIEDVIAGAIDPGEAARCDLSPSSEPETRLRNGFHVAYARLSMAAAGSEFQGMATTVAAALVETHQNEHTGHPAIVAHVGDSRVYRLHDGQLERLTRDHSWVEEQVRAGLLERDAARNHPWRSLITRAVSASEEEVEPDIDRFLLSPGDRLLVCSDGLTGVLTDAQISAVLTQSLGDEPTCQALVHMANLAGGPDNITVIVVSL
ncbi:MAG: PP2C family protein-serine/threonine phosphatase [Bacteroidales bacterium]